MNTETLIKEIHASDSFGCFSEAGCGTAVSSKLFEVAGASNTIYVADSPYNKEYQQEKYYGEDIMPNMKNIFPRSVSFEMVKKILDHSVDEFNSGKYPLSEKINTFYASSFQVGDEVNKTSTHGWIGLKYKSQEFYYHISIHEPMSRKAYISLIGEIGIKILYSTVIGGGNTRDKIVPADCYIDEVLDVPMDWMFSMLAKSEKENFLCIKNKNFVRLEELFRNEDNIILYKGSFNPVHNGHLTVVDLVIKKYNTNPVFVISSEVYQKGHIPAEELIHRVKMLNDLGFSVIVTRFGYFNMNVKYIRNKFPYKPVVFVVGSDTMNRIADSSYKIIGSPLVDVLDEVRKFKLDFKTTTFFVVNRPGFPLHTRISENLVGHHEIYDEAIDVSSSKIRELHEKGEFDEIKKLVPTKVYESLTTQLKTTI